MTKQNMKQYRLLFTEKEWLEVEKIIGEIPTKYGNPLLNLLIPKLQETVIDNEPKEKSKQS